MGIVALRSERARKARLPRQGPARQNLAGENVFPPPHQGDHLLVSHQLDAMRDR
jgi:hypothetical protein